MKDFKRQYRELSDEHREKISQATANKPKSAEHRLHISQAIKDYWQTVGSSPSRHGERAYNHERPYRCVKSRLVKRTLTLNNAKKDEDES